MTNNSTLTQEEIKSRIDTLVPVFARAAVGDFSVDMEIPTVEDEFTPVLAGIQIMLDVIREKIAESKAINNRLLERMEETTALLRSIGDGVAVLDTEGRVVFLNLAGERMTGVKESEAVGQRWIDLVPLEDEPGNRISAVDRPFEAEYEIPNEAPVGEKTFYYVTKTGHRFPVRTTVSPVIFEGNRTGIIIVFRDVTRQKELEHLKDEFLSIAAHELRTPLGTMRWTMEALLKEEQEPLSPTLRAKLEKLSQNNILMISLVNDILSISRLTGEDTIKEDKKPTKLFSITQAVAKDLEPQALAATISLKVETTDPSLTEYSFLIDEAHFRQVIENLLSNGIKYNRPGGSVVVQFSQTDTDICINVADTGIGIPPEETEHIFERFFRGTEVSKTNIPGTGLGLYVVESYVKKWGGKISFESTTAKGTTFHLCLPKTESIVVTQEKI
jgi:PAS domain S-box-containing protein